MIIVTGGAGFIGSNIIAHLNARNRSDILVVDDLTDGKKCLNLADLDIADYIDKDDFLELIRSDQFLADISHVFHLGACSATTEWDGHFVMKNNYEYSKQLLHWCANHHVSFIYASSASVYGMNHEFKEERTYEKPLNMYAYSKFLFDIYYRQHANRLQNQVAGLRYFNVYGPREQHKGRMSSVAYHFYHQLKKDNQVCLFEGTDGYGDGEQVRDFIHVDDVASVNLWLMDNPDISGIFNVGTGRAQSFNDVANACILSTGKGSIKYIPFPELLKGRYQSYTQANLDLLRQAGYRNDFMSVEQGVSTYMQWLDAHPE